MKIISKFKDYYDFISKKYGGGDPKVVYKRREIGKRKKICGQEVIVEVDHVTDVDLSLNLDDRYHKFKLGTLFIAGDCFLVIKYEGHNWELLDEFGKHKEIVKDYKNRIYRDLWLYKSKIPYFDGIRQKINREKDKIIQVAKEIKEPVFIIHNTFYINKGNKSQTCVKLDELCPILENVGIPSVLSAEQIYQKLAYFIGNVLCDSPDIKPPVELSDKEKIIKGGFDIKTSFRSNKK
jgi:hypothetical protein